MSGPGSAGRLGARIAALLRAGTLLAVAAIGAGFVIALVGGGAGPGPRPVLQLVADRGPDALIAIGLLGLTFLPLGMLGLAAATFGVERERRYLLSSLATLGLLVVSLVAAAIVAGPS